MFRCLSRFFKPPVDTVMEEIRTQFDFLVRDYGFSFAKEDLGNMVGRDGKRIFYGPYYAYQFYRDGVCINILYLMQRQEYDVFLTAQKSKDQIYIRSGTKLLPHLSFLAEELENALLTCREFYGWRIP